MGLRKLVANSFELDAARIDCVAPAPVRRVLVGVGDTFGTEPATQWALDLAARMHASVVLGHVVVPHGAIAGCAHAMAAQHEHSIYLHSTAAAARTAARTAVPFEIGRAGTVSVGLRDMALDQNADVLVVGRPMRSALARMLLESTCHRAAVEARCSVVVVPEESASRAPSRVVVCADDLNPRILHRGAEVAKAHGAALEILNVRTRPDERDPRGTIHRRLAELGLAGVVDRVSTEVGRPTDQIIAFGKQDEPWCLMVGARSTASLRKGLGSVTRRLIESSPCTLWIERAP